MKINNTSTINLVKNPITHVKSKHIEMTFHYLKEQVSNGRMCLKHCRSEDQIVYIMAKLVQVELFKNFRRMMGVQSLNTLN